MRTDTMRRPGRIEQGMVVLVLLFSTNAVIPALRQGGTLNTENNPDALMQVLWSLVYVAVIALLIVKYSSQLMRARGVSLLGLLIGATVLSTLWSLMPFLTAQRAFALIGTTALGTLLGLRYSRTELMRLVAWTLALAAIASVLFIVFLPGYGVSQDHRGAAWRGAFTTKGQMSQLMTLSSVVWFLYLRQSRRHLVIKLVLLLTSVTLVLEARSVTSLIALMAIAALIPAFKIFRWQFGFAIPMFLIYATGVGTFVIWAASNSDSLAYLFGRDPTLTGRTSLWQAVWGKVLERPLLGYGYSGFWRGWAGPSADVWLAIGWRPPHAHNGYLEIALQLGVVGIVLYAAVYMQALTRAVTLARHTKGIEGEFPLVFLLFTFVVNFSEVYILGRNTIYWVLFVTILVQAPVAVPLNERIKSSRYTYGRVHLRSVAGGLR